MPPCCGPSLFGAYAPVSFCFDAEAVTDEAVNFYVAMRRLKARNCSSSISKVRINKKDMLHKWQQREVKKNYVQEEIWVVKKDAVLDSSGKRIDLSKDRDVKNWLIPFDDVEDQLPEDITEDKYYLVEQVHAIRHKLGHRPRTWIVSRGKESSRGTAIISERFGSGYYG